MLTRLKVNGFKNLVDVDVRFGPFTCIAGVNGSGKSNLFDAIRFLAALAEKPLVEAALSIRGGRGSSDIRDLFHRVGNEYANEMSFEAEMIVPTEGIDVLRHPIYAEDTVVRYCLSLSLASDSEAALGTGNLLRIEREELSPIIPDEIQQALAFTYTPAWRTSASRQRWNDALIWTEMNPDGAKIIKLRKIALRLAYLGRDVASDDASPEEYLAAELPRTVLSSLGLYLGATAILAQQEMRSWRVLELNPATMREPDDFTAPARIGSDGSHMAAALYRLAHSPSMNGRDLDEVEAAVYARVGNRLARLLDDVRDVKVDRDDGRELLTLKVAGRDQTFHSARSLSDGTLRFLALAVLLEQEEPGLFCIEEPENGIHPGRIQALIDLLQSIAMDTSYPIESGNPLRQVIISTHSPSVVVRVPEDSLIVAEIRDTARDGKHFNRAHFSGLTNTWRAVESKYGNVALGTLLAYLNPEGYRPLPEPDPERDPDAAPRIMDRADVRDLFSPVSRLDG